jgi:hypothetical protein
MEEAQTANLSQLNDSWCLWAHLPHDADWSLNSYKLLYTFKTVEETVSLINNLSEKCIKNCMLFIMRENINPIWEDEKNRDGGCFSFKISNKQIKDIWEILTYALVGENIFTSNKDNLKINGITISPKKNFCIIKIWLNTCEYKNLEGINKLLNLEDEIFIFKKHISE